MEAKVATASKGMVPKRGDHESATQHQGVFEVVGVNALMQAANIRLVDGSGPIIPNVPWTDLKPPDKK